MCDPRTQPRESRGSTTIISVKLFIIKNLQPVETCDPHVSNQNIIAPRDPSSRANRAALQPSFLLNYLSH